MTGLLVSEFALQAVSDAEYRIRLDAVLQKQICR